MISFARGMALALVGLQVAVLSACQASPMPSAATPRGAQAFQARSAEADLYPTAPGSRWEYTLHQRQNDGPVKLRPMTIATTSAA